MSAQDKKRKKPTQRQVDRTMKFLDMIVNDECSIFFVKREHGKGGIFIKEFYTEQKAKDKFIE